MTTNHIDQLTEWWNEAEEGTAAPGDWIITHGPDDTSPAYIVEQAPRYPLSSKCQPYRILARAPKPAWHDAAAVMARVDDTQQRRVLMRDGDRWIDLYDQDYMAYELTDVTPLIEAKVTDEMVERALGEAEAHGCIEHVFGEVDDMDRHIFRAILTAALGVEAE